MLLWETDEEGQRVRTSPEHERRRSGRVYRSVPFLAPRVLHPGRKAARIERGMKSSFYIGDVAAAGGVTAQAVRYYEGLGLLEKPQRSRSGYRVYRLEAIQRMRFIKDAQKLGLSLNEIRVIIRMKCSMQPPCDCVRDLLQKKLARIEKQIAAMDATRKKLLKVLRGTDGLPPLLHEESVICPLIEHSATKRPHPASD